MDESLIFIPVKNYHISWVIILLKIFWIQHIHAQQLSDLIKPNTSIPSDTIILTMEEAEGIFLKNNLLLIAQKLNIEESRALVIQSRLYNNPSFYLETNPHNQFSNRWFSYGSEVLGANGFFEGNEVISYLAQTIITAGKRSNLIKLRKINLDITENEYYDLVRTLTFSLRNDYFLLVQYQQGIQLLEAQLRALNILIESLNVQVAQGNVALKELLRIQALAFNVENILRDLVSNRADAESDFKTLLRFPANLKIVAVKDTTRLYNVTLPSLDSLAALSFDNRYDLKAAASQVHASETNYKLQKSYAYPDLDLGVTFERYSNYIPNYLGVGARFNLPVWNRNQGNIKMAKVDISSQEALYENQLRDAVNDLSSAYVSFLKIQNVYDHFKISFEKRYDEYFKNLIKNYEQHTIGLIEFVDFFESYRDMKIAAYNLEQDYMLAKEELNFLIGKGLFK